MAMYGRSVSGQLLGSASKLEKAVSDVIRPTAQISARDLRWNGAQRISRMTLKTTPLEEYHKSMPWLSTEKHEAMTSDLELPLQRRRDGTAASLILPINQIESAI